MQEKRKEEKGRDKGKINRSKGESKEKRKLRVN